MAAVSGTASFEEAEALLEEGATLLALAQSFSAADWQRPTPFKQWTPWDVFAHLHLSDEWAAASLQSQEAFRCAIAPLLAALNQKTSLRDYARARYAALDGPSLMVRWHTSLMQLGQQLAHTDPKARLSWFGPDMGARMFATARYMETWAHGQDLYDLLGRERIYNDRIRAIVTLGLRTYGFCFANRRLKPPAPEPYLRLTAPSGAIWEWNTASQTDCIEGLASEFCHVVTQNRNVADTGLRVIGESARQWMAIAQCFAGPPEDPPAPGSRVGAGRLTT